MEIIFSAKQKNGRFPGLILWNFPGRFLNKQMATSMVTRTDWDDVISRNSERSSSPRGPPGGFPESLFDNLSSLGKEVTYPEQPKGKEIGWISNFHPCCQRWVWNKLREVTSPAAEVSIWQKQSEVGGNCKSCGNLEIWDSEVRIDTIFENMYSGLFMDHLLKIPSSL